MNIEKTILTKTMLKKAYNNTVSGVKIKRTSILKKDVIVIETVTYIKDSIYVNSLAYFDIQSVWLSACKTKLYSTQFAKKDMVYAVKNYVNYKLNK